MLLSNTHTRAYELHLKEKKDDAIDKKLSTMKHGRCGSSDVITGISTMEVKDFERTKKKFEAAYFIAKEELPLKKYEIILLVENSLTT